MARAGWASRAGPPGLKTIDRGAIDIRDGRAAVPYDEKDRLARQHYEGAMAANDMKNRLPAGIYRTNRIKDPVEK